LNSIVPISAIWFSQPILTKCYTKYSAS